MASIRKLIPNKLYAFFKSVKDAMAVNWKCFRSNSDIRRHKKRIRKKLARGESVNVVFLAQFPEMWNSEKSVYKAMKQDSRFAVTVYAVPKRSNAENDQLFQENPAYGFFQQEGIPAIDAMAGGAFRPIEDRADFIFVQRPYDGNMPTCYHLNALSKKGLVCYIPYFGSTTNGALMTEIEFNPGILSWHYAIFADCEDSYQFISGWKTRHRFTKNKKVYNIGFPRFDLITPASGSSKERRDTFLWLPRWALKEFDPKRGNSHFLDYVEVLLQYFDAHRDLKLIIRPHPLMFSNFVKHGAMTAEEVRTMKERVAKMENVSFDENLDYLITFEQTDFLIADMTSLLLEFFCTGKPIIRTCDSLKPGALTSDAEKMVATFYMVLNAEQLISAIDDVSAGNDKYQSEREAIIRESFKVDGRIGERIKDSLIADL